VARNVKHQPRKEVAVARNVKHQPRKEVAVARNVAARKAEQRSDVDNRSCLVSNALTISVQALQRPNIDLHFLNTT
jgi:hypothetical protein